ncbi:hypothetical protein MYX82_08955 [Acidobacteria bacterium AH-259-D05]|nr:hypothetical protein [Acidobacteria bacterium AH-259-D05]
MIGSGVNLSISLSGNLLLAGVFLSALVYPSEDTSFVLNAGLLIFLIEFLSIHSSAMAWGVKKGKVQTSGIAQEFFKKHVKETLIVLYSLFAITFAVAFKNVFYPLYFFVSLIGKFFGDKAAPSEQKTWVEVGLFIVSMYIVLPFSGILQEHFPIPYTLYNENPDVAVGLFSDTPHTVLAWGVIYFILLTIVEIMFFVRRTKQVKP